MSRRAFLSHTTATFAGAIAGPIAAGSSGSAARRGYFFFDERFAASASLAEEWAHCARPISVRGDVTTIWNTWLRHASAGVPVTLHGLTTESFRFCLEVLLRDEARVATRVARVDRDLFFWSMRSEPIEALSNG